MEKLYKLQIIIANPSNLIGPGPSGGVCTIFARKIVQMEENKIDKVLEVNNLLATRDFLDVRDAVRAYEVLLNKGEPGKGYEIASGKKYSLEDIIATFKNLTDIDFKVQSLCNDVDHTVKEIVPIELLNLGWSPNFEIEKSLTDTLNYFRNKEHFPQE